VCQIIFKKRVEELNKTFLTKPFMSKFCVDATVLFSGNSKYERKHR